jgi:uncharacterized membrane protein YjdF
MAIVPTTWLIVRRRRGGAAPIPWAGFAFIIAPFLIDMTGNTLDLYDTVDRWDDINHFFNWLLLCLGIGLLLERGFTYPRWALWWLIAGIGALLAIGWELGEWYAFIRHGTERATAYQDTLGDQALGTLGGMTAATILWWWQSPSRRGKTQA